MVHQHFPILILIARPGAGKSEIIHYLQGISGVERCSRFHIADFDVIDDFPMLWTWFEEDDLLETMGHDRLHTTADGYFRWDHLWDLLIARIGLEYQKRLRDQPDIHARKTIILEFSRGSEHGGYKRAFTHLPAIILSQAAILYVQVSYAESMRKNRARFHPDSPDSILHHSLSDDKMDRLYRESDWAELIDGNPDYLSIQGLQVPYAVLENEDDVTTLAGEALGRRLDQAFHSLWMRFIHRSRVSVTNG